MPGRFLRLFLFALLLLSAVDCGKDCRTCPGDDAPDPTLANIWPHEDGAFWFYVITGYSAVEDTLYFFENPEDVPPAPSLDVIAALLENQPAEEDTLWLEAFYMLTFDGEITTALGTTGQDLTPIRQKVMQLSAAQRFVQPPSLQGGCSLASRPDDRQDAGVAPPDRSTRIAA